MYDFQTSLPAYQVAKESLNKTQETVYHTIRKIGVCCDSQIANFLGWPINRVTPRRGELLTNGKIKMIYKDKDFTTGRRVNFWTINH